MNVLIYGTVVEILLALVKGRSYTFRLRHTGTNRPEGPDYDWLCLINDSDATGPRVPLYGTGPFYVEDYGGLLNPLFNGDDINFAEGKVGRILVPKIELLTAYSDQIPNRTANPLPTLNNENTMYMGAWSDNKGYLRIQANVTPTECASHVLIGVRQMGTTTILASAPYQVGETLLNFNNAGGFQRYEVVAGLDINTDGILQNSEVCEVMPKQFVLVTQSDYDSADNTLWVGTALPGVAGNLLHAFRTGTIPPGATQAGKTLYAQQLSHPVGAVWEANNTAVVMHYTFSQSSTVAQAVASAVPTVTSVESHLKTTSAFKDVVQSYFQQFPNEPEQTFGPWPFPPTLIGFGPMNPDLLFAFGHVTISGQIWVTVRNPDLRVMSIEYAGSFTDLYDFDHSGEFPAPTAAKVQTGFSTLGNSGKVFFTTVEFQRQTSDINHTFQ